MVSEEPGLAQGGRRVEDTISTRGKHRRGRHTVPQATPGAHDGDPLTRPGCRLLQALVDGDAGAENGGNGIEGNVFGNVSNVGSFCDGILLECAVNGVAGEEGLGTEGLVSLLAK